MKPKAMTQKYSRGNKRKDPLSTKEKKPEEEEEKEKDMKGRLMCFTWFHEKPIEFDTKVMQYLAYGHETCPTTGRKHLQGWVYWKNARSMFACRGQYKCWIAVCKGTIDQQDEYCSKESTLTTFGKRPRQGERSDLKRKIDAVIKGEETVDDIIVADPEFFHKYGRTLQNAEDIAMRKRFRTEMTTCEWLWGKTGVGKSHIALKDYNPETHYIVRNDNGWWEGYRQQHTVVINDFRGEIKYSELLQLIDKWPYHVKRRGREPMPFTSKHIIITSSLPPEEVYYNLSERDGIDQLLRRLTVREITK